MVLWEWLDSVVMHPPEWLAALVSRVSVCLATPMISHKLEASKYLSASGFPTMNIPVYEIPSRQRDLSSMDKEVLVDRLTDILAFWLQFPIRSRYQPQAWFIRHIISYVGVQAMLLPSISIGASHLNTYVLERGVNSKIKCLDIDAWAHHRLSSLPITRPSSPEYASLQSIWTTVTTLFPQIGTTLEFFEDSKPQEVVRGHVDGLLDLFKLVDPLLSCPSLSISLPSKTTTGYYWKALLLDIQADLDKCFPYRDLATSRTRILQEPSPFSAPHLRTASGFFSALVYRGITHHTKFLLEQDTLFQSAEEYDALVTRLTPNHDKIYFCDRRAYGRQSVNRSTVHAKKYWESAQNMDWTWWLYEDEPASFLEVFKTIRK
ncbi:hypothetical protein BDN72DRAFT_866454, partial [Pluteus cervinus]